MSKKTLYIHTGLYKTGTTSIQHFCYHNKEALAKQGYCYPDVGIRFRNKSYMRNAIFLTLPYDAKEEIDAFSRDESNPFDDGMKVISQFFEEYDNLILSDEAIFYKTAIRTPNLWKKIAHCAEEGGYSVKMIVYLRRQDELTESFWNQLIKRYNHHTYSFDDFIENYMMKDFLRYYDVLSLISDSIGKENIIVRRFARKHFLNGSIYDDFADCLNLKLTDEFIQTDDANSGLSCNLAEIKRIFNQLDDADTNSFIRRTLSSADPSLDKKYRLFSCDEAKAFVQQYGADNDKIVEEYIKDGLPLFDEVQDNKEKWHIDNDEMLRDMIKTFSLTTQTLIRENKKLAQENERIHKRVDRLEKKHNRLVNVLKHPWRAGKK